MDQKNGRILIIDDNKDILQAARLFLKQHVQTVHTEETPDVLPGLLERESFDVILLDLNFAKGETSGREGFRWLGRILEADPAAVIILITAYGDIDMAVRAIKEGATDFILKPWPNEKLLATVSAALRLRSSRLEAESLRRQTRRLEDDLDQPFQEFVGDSPPMRAVFSTLRKVAKTDANVLILGENGTGKELVARELHRQSERRGRIFVGVDVAALSETLFESELFGHVKGAFTDAREDRAGRFELASGGTLFLDEIGNIPLPQQAKLLRALEARSVTRLGSNKAVPVDVRLITATNRPIHDLAFHGGFRRDLLYRINTVEITLPPLRERGSDLVLLTEHFLRLYGRKYGKHPVRASAATLRRLSDYPWPGNVRELQHAVERAVILSESQDLEPPDFCLPQAKSEANIPESGDLKLEEVEKTLIRKVLGKHGGNISRAAKELGLSRTALYRRLEKHGL